MEGGTEKERERKRKEKDKGIFWIKRKIRGEREKKRIERISRSRTGSQP